MGRRPPEDHSEQGLDIAPPADHAAGLPAVVSALRHGLREMGPARTARTPAAVNQAGGFDCMGCAWPDPARRHHAEFCENGAKAVAGVARRAERFRAVAYDTPRGCAAAYYSETNPLVPLDSVAEESGTPTSKSVVVRLEKSNSAHRG